MTIFSGTFAFSLECFPSLCLVRARCLSLCLSGKYLQVLAGTVILGFGFGALFLFIKNGACISPLLQLISEHNLLVVAYALTACRTSFEEMS
jgi:hypothetical protein